MSKRDGDICRMRLLVVDDDPDVNKMLCVMLSKNYPTQCILSAHDAKSALRVVNEIQPDIVLVDVFMPGGGIELTPKLMSGSESRIVVHMSTRDDYELINQCYEAGSKYFFRKPIHFQRLFSKLDSFMVDLFYKRYARLKTRCWSV